MINSTNPVDTQADCNHDYGDELIFRNIVSTTLDIEMSIAVTLKNGAHFDTKIEFDPRASIETNCEACLKRVVETLPVGNVRIARVALEMSGSVTEIVTDDMLTRSSVLFADMARAIHVLIIKSVGYNKKGDKWRLTSKSSVEFE